MNTFVLPILFLSISGVLITAESRAPNELTERRQPVPPVPRATAHPFTKRPFRPTSPCRETPDSTARPPASGVVSKYLGPRIEFAGESVGINSSV